MPAHTTDPTAISSLQAQEAAEYLSKNKVHQIVQQLVCACLYERPDDPKEFMVRKLEEMRNARARGQSLVLFTRENLVALFRIFDVTSRGAITKQQYDQAMKNIGAYDKANARPSGIEQDLIRQETFVEEAAAALSKLR
ncbi:uncharacterized protein EV422DRAFT_62379 [Fimicolochytrium jonesii]|uniref:uncharacterized protein n=1 Tax=Fimicolochytrium jonesii TaxID=1396493 RepID=UPI0022FE68A5|nr:uncharacterized protein EV422DRAFT_62379 [Fimicolochytrium jonesii]KAI8820765.1 hypothetical protein EV422DRAFT_62379 [Fimicolochytrium jonesii]